MLLKSGRGHTAEDAGKAVKLLKEAGFEPFSFVFPAGERSKNIGTLSEILEFLGEIPLTRSDCVIALGGGVVGAIVFILVFFIGHTLNLAINLLGAYVHTNRLQFVEFFGKFYEGGGRAFRPFAVHTQYYNIKEDF